MPEKIKLTSDDWKALLPETDFMLGNVKLPLKPMTAVQVAKIARIIQNSLDLFKEREITKDNYLKPENLSLIADILMTTAPDIISDCAGLDIDDVKALPLEHVLTLINALIAINLEAKESLEKNLKALTATLTSLKTTVNGR